MRRGDVFTRYANECALAELCFGGADGIRTHDLLDAIEARSQLRHGPTGEKRLLLLYHRGSRPVKPACLFEVREHHFFCFVTPMN